MSIPSKYAIVKINSQYRSSGWLQSHTLYPYPAYEAHFFDDTVGRVTFWQETGKPWDVLRARRLAESIYGKTVHFGFIEYDNPDQPWFRALDTDLWKAQQKKKPRTTANQLTS